MCKETQCSSSKIAFFLSNTPTCLVFFNLRRESHLDTHGNNAAAAWQVAAHSVENAGTQECVSFAFAHQSFTIVARGFEVDNGTVEKVFSCQVNRWKEHYCVEGQQWKPLQYTEDCKSMNQKKKFQGSEFVCWPWYLMCGMLNQSDNQHDDSDAVQLFKYVPQPGGFAFSRPSVRPSVLSFMEYTFADPTSTESNACMQPVRIPMCLHLLNVAY